MVLELTAEFSPTFIVQLAKALLFKPHEVIEALHQNRFPISQLRKARATFFILTSALFAWSALVLYPGALTVTQTLLRFLFMMSASLLIVIPLVTLVWSALQKYACWFFNVNIPFKVIFQVASLGSVYYTFIFMVGILLSLLHLPAIQPTGPLILELCLFALNLTAFILSIRLIQAMYRVMGAVSTKRAVVTALSPAFVIVCLGMLIEFLTILAIYPKIMSKV